MSKNVAVFVDVANIFYAAKAANIDIDYVTLLKSAVAGRDFVRAYAYTGLDPDNENQRNFHQFLARHGYKVVSKDIRKYGDGKVKANLDIELVVDMMKTARNLDVAIVVSGDGDFAPAIRAVQEMGVRVEVISFRGNTSSDLIDVADVFTDIIQIAKVEKGSRSGRRVAGDEEDLSMTEVPEKQTEGPSRPRSRRGGRGRAAEKEPAVARTSAEDRNGAGRGAPPLTVLPGEKLSRAGTAEDAGALEAFGEGGPAHEDELSVAGEAAEGDDSEAPRRRRRRRGGRGRGRGRGTEQGQATELPEEAEDEALETPAPRPAAQRSSFGSVWDSQLGVPPATTRGGPTPNAVDQEDEDFDEPEIPEYLIAERRRGQTANRGGRGQQGGGRGRNAAYAAAVDRERFGGRAGGTRYGEPPRSRPPQPGPRQEPRREQRPQAPARAPRSGEPWSEVPPELEEMLRAQLQVRPEPAAATRPRRSGAAPMATPAAEGQAAEALAVEAEAVPREAAAPARRRSSRRATSAVEATSPPNEAAAPESAPKRRTTRRSAQPADATPETGDRATGSATPAADTADADSTPTRRTRTTRARPPADTASAEEASSAEGAAAGEPAPKPPTRRRSAPKAE
jgi:uncharacterized LabA/DUF88 family protein